ncbi:hypothetical protein M409DRAFT_56828 [Zasmidium cellare ATCC 36951]|uniref:BTB domain-containing protein n=1 Tax=Zasmidium cellare ATCC 36951 TaxID=1080233 RepID=A0A6A6CFD2_ZASCE|nr:uncharacterized protein M409DRAFT_56828 [Zasmidium cellare ATCC 36951]KAF2164116.1 hypothetical protein M409DRAFT_56828 [Zasmidium cellare ATCC 36951]
MAVNALFKAARHAILHTMDTEAQLPTTTCLEGAIPVLSGLPALLANFTLSDFTIKTTTGSLAVHRVLLSLHSSVLAKACDGDFRETPQASIDLVHEPAACVKAMVHYMYHFDYDLPEDEEVNASVFHVGMALIGDKYDVAALKDAASIKFKASLPTTADGADAFAETLDLAYDNAVALRDLCKYLVTFALDNSEVGVSAQFHPALKKVMQKHPDLAMNVTEAMYTRMKENEAQYRKYDCPHCDRAEVFIGDLQAHTYYKCRGCECRYSGQMWRSTSK